MTGPEVLALRQRMGWRQVDLAEKAGVTERTVQRWEEDGTTEAISRFLALLAEADDAAWKEQEEE